MKNLALIPTTALALLWAASPTTAADPVEAEAAEEKSYTVEDVLFVEESLPYLPASNTIASKLPVEVDRTPANVGIVTPQLLEEQDAEVLGDALENISGLNRQTGNGVFDFFVIRGFDSLTSGLVLTDGAPEPEATFYQLYNAERVEVFKGPSGFLYGSNPLAGVVNIVRKQPVPADFAVLGASLGSFGTLEGNLDLNRASSSGELSFRLNGLWRESDGYRDGRSSEAVAINPSLRWQPNEETSLHLNLELLGSDFTPDAGLPLVDGRLAEVPRTRSYASPFDRSTQDVYRLQLDYERRLSEATTLRNKTYYRGLDWVTDGTLINGVFQIPGFGSPVARTLLELDDRQRFVGNQLELLTAKQTGRVRHEILAGLEVARFADDFTLGVSFLPTIDLFNPVETAVRPLFPIPGQGSAGDTRSVVVAPYVVDQIAFSERVQLMVGLRFDDIDFEDSVTGTRRSDGELSPMVGLVVSPKSGWSVYANAGESFAPPSPRVAGDRVPEESRQIELGLRRESLGGRLRSTLAVFQLDRENIAIPDDNGFTQQAGDQRTRGVELEVVGRLGNGLRTALAYAYTDSELTRFAESVFLGPVPPFFLTIDRSGNTAAFAPRHLLNLWLSKRLDGGLTLAGGARFVDDQFIAEDNLAQIDSHVLIDASVIYTVGDWRLALNLENLTDADYETRGFGSFSVIPGLPFSASLDLRYRL